MLLRKLTSMVFCVLLVASSVYGATITESFDYTDGQTIQGLGGGTGWADGSTWMHPQWTFAASANVVESPSLAYPGVTSVGGKAVFNMGAASAYPMRLMGTTFNEGDTFYIGFIAQKTVASDNTRWFSVALLPNVNVGVLDKAYMGQGSGISTYQMWLGGTTLLDSGVNSQTLAYLLAKVELRSGTEKVTFWVNPDLSQPEDVSTAVGGMSHDTPTDWGSIGAVRIGGSGPGSGQLGASHVLDELVISTDSPFVPEPASLLVLAIGTSLVLLRKK